MKRSTDRILTTHVGSLPRPNDMLGPMLDRLDGKPVDEAAFTARVSKAVRDIVKQQADVGLDIVNDGEMGKISFITYAGERLAGIEKQQGERPSPFSKTRETASFPEYYESTIAQQVSSRRRRQRVVCSGPVSYKGQSAQKAEIDNLMSALAGVTAGEAFERASARVHWWET